MILLKDIKLILHERRMITVLAILSVILCLGVLFAKPARSGEGVRFGVADLDDSEYSRLLVTYFKESREFSSFVTLVAGNEEELSRMLEDREIDLYLVIPPKFAEMLMNIDNLPIKAVIDSSDKTKAVLYKNLLAAYGNYISAVEINAQAVYDLMGEEGYDAAARTEVNYRLSYDLIFTALGKDEIFNRDEIERVKGTELVNYYVYSLLFLAVLYSGMLFGLSFLNERKSLAAKRLAAAGTGFARQFVSKLTAAVITSGSVLVILLFIINLGKRMFFDTGAILLTLTALILSGAFFMMVSLLPFSKAGYVTFANMLILMLTIIGGGIIPIMYLPQTLKKIAVLTPTYIYIKAML